jgi:hypothetical protein
MYKKIIALLLISATLQAQEDSTTTQDDFDFSDFELAAPAAKSFCNNKVLGQSPTSLIGAFYTFQGPQNFTAGDFSYNGNSVPAEETNNIEAMHAYSLVGNFPLISRNNILINLNVVYNEQHYQFENANATHPLTQNLQNNPLRSANTVFTIFKPLNSRNFILSQIGLGLNGDYSFSDFSQAASTLRYSAALLYGFKPNDRLMYAFGASRTYLGGALNYVPIVYYFHTFKNEKWGVEALLPARAFLRYRFNSTSLLGVGFNVTGNTYRLNGIAEQNTPPLNDNLLAGASEFELRRSEIRAGVRYSRAISGFFWLTAEAGYRINYSFDVDEGGDFLRFFGSDKPYFIENQLGNPLYFQIGISYVSP